MRRIKMKERCFVNGSMVKVTCPYVAKPQALHYAWEGNPDCNLCNSEGLPCAPFRTDDWEDSRP